MTNSRYVDIRYEGIVKYEVAIELMKVLQKQRIENEINDTLLILEHPEIAGHVPVRKRLECELYVSSGGPSGAQSLSQPKKKELMYCTKRRQKSNLLFND